MTIPRRLDNDYAAGRAHGYGIGCMDGANAQSKRDRVAAFAAIRRAAALARDCDAKSEWCRQDRLRHGHLGIHTSVVAWANEAEQIRRAIRAAIGSEKA